ncbi:MAG: hypothetical protein RLZZ282_144 [Verrucomicrobiota bacterium]|jgi:uncharacterized membrane protein
MKRAGRLVSILEPVIMGLALAGFALNVVLCVRHITGGGLAGCGGGSSCDELLNSRWAQVIGIPVTGLGGMVYLGLMVVFAVKNKRLVALCLGAIVGAAAWFIFVQAVVVGRFCPWCMTAHGIGVAIALLGSWYFALGGHGRPVIKALGLSAGVTVLGMSLLQVYGPRPVTHRMEDVHGATGAVMAGIHARGTGRKVEFDGGRKAYDLTAMPHLGRVDAKRVLVEYFDYSCSGCQVMSGYLDALIEKHPAEVCVVVLPVPLARSCNHVLVPGDIEHPEACELAKLALVVWRTHPDAFPGFHRLLLRGATLAVARAKVIDVVGAAARDAALRDPWIDELLRADIGDWVTYSSSSRKLPKLLVSGQRILHGLPSGEADFIRVMEHELGL